MAGDDLKEGLQNNLGSLLDSSPDCILVCDVHTLQYLYANDMACRMTGYSRDELLAMTPPMLLGISEEEIREINRKAENAGPLGYTDEPRLLVDRTRSRRGWWEGHVRFQEVGGQGVIVIFSSEVTGRVLAERAAARTKRIYAALSATNEAIMRMPTREALFQAVCDAAIDSGGMTTAALLMPRPGSDIMETKAMAGIGREALEQTVMSISPDRPEGRGLVGTSFRSREPCVSNDYFRDRRTAPWQKQMRDSTKLKSVASVPIVQGETSVGTLHLCSRERNAFDEEIVALLVRMADNIAFALHTFDREEERREAEEKAHYLATHCSLTGLPNRNLLSDLLDQAIAAVERTGHKPAVMFVDLDNFKEINDTLGHDVGDRVLEKVAGRLRKVLRGHDVLARLGGDEFVVLLQNIRRPEDAGRVSEKLLSAMEEPVVVDDQPLQVTLSIGVSLFPDHGDNQKALMRSADLAMYQAKEKGRNTWALYAPEHQADAIG